MPKPAPHSGEQETKMIDMVLFALKAWAAVVAICFGSQLVLWVLVNTVELIREELGSGRSGR